MDLPVMPPVEPMLATSVPEIPSAEGMRYEPKWDGFRTIIFRDGDEVELVSRGGKTMTRYFPEVVEQALAQLPPRCVVDGEVVLIRRAQGRTPCLDFELLQQRIHPAASRVRMLAATTPCDFVAFDLLALGDETLMTQPYERRRRALETALATVRPPVHVTPTTQDLDTARRWFDVFEGAGLDGVMAKPATIDYVPGKRLMFKIKHAREADCVVAGFRWHKSGDVLGSLLLGLFDDEGNLHHVGVSASFTAARRRELVEELAPLRENAREGHPWLAWLEGIDAAQPRSGEGRAASSTAAQSNSAAQPRSGEGRAASSTAAQSNSAARIPGGLSRWSAGKDLSWEPLRPERVVEVGYDAMEGDRFRHTAQFRRWRPDRTPDSCTYAQLQRPLRFDVDEVLSHEG